MTSISLDRFDATPMDKGRVVFGSRRYEVRSRALWGGLFRQKPRWRVCIHDDGNYAVYRRHKSHSTIVSHKFGAALYHAVRIQHGPEAVAGELHPFWHQ